MLLFRDIGGQQLPLLPLSIPSRISVQGVVWPVFRAGAPSSVQVLWKCPRRHMQRCVSWVIRNPVKLTMKGNRSKDIKIKVPELGKQYVLGIMALKAKIGFKSWVI